MRCPIHPPLRAGAWGLGPSCGGLNVLPYLFPEILSCHCHGPYCGLSSPATLRTRTCVQVADLSDADEHCVEAARQVRGGSRKAGAAGALPSEYSEVSPPRGDGTGALLHQLLSLAGGRRGVRVSSQPLQPARVQACPQARDAGAGRRALGVLMSKRKCQDPGASVPD